MSEPGESGEASRVVIEARGIGKGYGMPGHRVDVLSGLDFSASEGEIIAVVGASGVGKSTFLHIIGGIDRPDVGQVLFRGRDVNGLDEIALARFRNEQIGFVFQFHYLLPEFTALENVMMPRLMRGDSSRLARERAADLLSEMGLTERATHRPGELSGGEQQRVAIARALVAEPGLVVADEPTGNLDRHTGEQVFEVFAERVKARALTTVIATHNEALAARCTRVFRIEEGLLEPVQPPHML